MALKIIRTEDGSESLYSDELNETYHSTKGARSESEYVFLEMGVAHYQPRLQGELRILEVGFGTGLNAWLMWKWADEQKMPVHFYSLEPFPIPLETWQEMALGQDELFRKLHGADWNQEQQQSPYFTLDKRTHGLEKERASDSFDLIFFDAFAPSKQPDVWSVENLEICYNALKTGGVLTTYCAQGQFKRNLAAVGFDIEVLSGALGKKEMVRATKK